MFGYEPGAFTDARRRKEGLLERADGGTLFLDEIGNMSANVQAKLLRVLEEGTFMRLGGTKPIKVDVRIIAATNANLKEDVANGKFREDLYYRLNVVPLYIPPLRDRKQDIMPLALHMVERYNKELKKNFTGFTPAAAEVMTSYSWPGNIRELKNVIERTMILAPKAIIDDAISRKRSATTLPGSAESKTPWYTDALPTGQQFVTLRELEDRYIHEVLVATGHNKAQAARSLASIPRRSCGG